MLTLVRYAVSVGMTTLACVSVAASQGDPQSSAIEIEALKYVQRDVRHRTLLLEPRMANPARFEEAEGLWGATRPASRTAVLTTSLGVRIANKHDVVRCEGSRPRCSIAEGTVLVALGEPEIHGDSATMEVVVWQYSRRPAHLHQLADFRARLTFARTSRGWETVRKQPLVVS